MLFGSLIIGMLVVWFFVMRAIYRELERRSHGTPGYCRHAAWYFQKYPERDWDDYARDFPDA